MGDLAIDTAVRARGDGRFEATISRDWEIWGPMGGYVAACALRAAGEETEQRRPAAFSCHYYRAAEFGAIDLLVTTRKHGRTATAQRVEMTQGDQPVLDAMVWSVGEVEGLEHDETVIPDVAPPDDLPDIRDLVPEGDAAPFKFWDNLDARPLDFEREWPPPDPRPARWKEWLRFTPTPTYQDEWIDATRSVILVDLPSWPAAHRPHAWANPQFIAPTLDLTVAFHQSARGEEWLLCDGAAPLSTGGLYGWTARIWSPGGKLHASGGGQCIYRRLPPETAKKE